MISWVTVAIALLKVASNLLSWARERELIADGEAKIIFEQSKAVMAITDAGKRYMEKIDALSPAALDDLTDAIGNAGSKSAAG